MVIVTFTWVALGFSLSFGTGNALIGNFDLIGLQHVINGKNFIRSAIEPESIETAIVQNIIWNSINNANGLYNCSFNTFRFNR
jgi:ammonia channel protein AmtB